MQSRGDANSWQVMLERFVKEQNAQEKKKLLYGLGTFYDFTIFKSLLLILSPLSASVNKPWLLNQFMRLATNETIVRSQDYLTTLRYIASNPIGTYRNNKLSPFFSDNVFAVFLHKIDALANALA